VTLFSRFYVTTIWQHWQSAQYTRLSFHDANWRENADNKTSSTDALPTHDALTGVERFINLGPRALEMLRAPR